MDENIWFGFKEVIINGPVVSIKKDEDLELFGECCTKVCKMYVEIQKEKEITENHV